MEDPNSAERVLVLISQMARRYETLAHQRAYDPSVVLGMMLEGIGLALSKCSFLNHDVEIIEVPASLTEKKPRSKKEKDSELTQQNALYT